MIFHKIKDFLRLESASGILLLLAAILAMLVVNSSWQVYYDGLINTPVAIKVGEFEIAKPLLLWINDGLMAIFFFLIGLEVKREVLAGELSQPSKVILPVVAAIGGMAVPALIYAAINWGDPVAIRGWAIPAATDIAFALGVLALLGSRVPQALKIFLMTLAIIDDLGAIVIIAIFYTDHLSFISLYIAIAAITLLFILNKRGILSLVPYILVGLVLWIAVLKSGVHATLAGVIIAFFIPFVKVPGEPHTKLEKLEHDLHPSVAYFILPLFAFANAGIFFGDMTINDFMHPVSLGIAAGLFIGKQVGVFGFSWIAIKLGFAKMPDQVSYAQLYGAALVCGVGFTMSLFIGSLAFNQGGVAYTVDDRLGIMVGSLISGVVGYLVLWFVTRNRNQAN